MSTTKGVISVKEGKDGQLLNTRIIENPEPVGTIGVDAWGKTILTKKNDRLILNLGEKLAAAKRVDPAISKT